MTTTDQTPTDTVKRVPARTIRRRILAERAAYVVAAAGTAVGPQLDAGGWSHLGAIGTLAGAGFRLYYKATPKDGDTSGMGLLRAAQRGLPVLTGAGLYTANLVHGGGAWWEYVAPAVWAGVMGLFAPITRSAGLTLEALPAVLQSAGVAEPAADAGPVRRAGYAGFLEESWERAAPNTRLTTIRQLQFDRPDFEAVVVAQRGQAVPTMSPTALAAAFDFPVGSVTLKPLLGSGPGRMVLTAVPTMGAQGQQEQSLEQFWEERVSGPGGAAPGMRLIDHRAEENRLVMRVRAEDGKLIDLPQLRLARALKVANPDLLMVETDGLGDAVVSVYETHPLISIREAVPEDLTMGEDGRIQLGLRPDGRPGRIPLYDPVLGAITDLFVGAPGAGKSVTLNTILAAERISGVVSIVADAQDGMSLPEANGRTYHFGAGIAAVAATLSAAYAVARCRQQVSAANGWGGFEIGRPWALANITLDELNLILAADADVPAEFRKLVTGLIAKFQSTGRKFGMGLRFAAQSIHLEDLGDKDKIRANAKNGTVSLGRTNSSTTQHMATDGVVPSGMTIEPIPRYFRSEGAIDAAWRGEEEQRGPVTAGLAWLIQGGSVFQMRTFKTVKVNKTFPGLIALYESAPVPGLTPEEDAIFQRAYAEALPAAQKLLEGEDGDDQGDDWYPALTTGPGPAAAVATPGFDPPAAAVPPGFPVPGKAGSSLKEQIVKLLADNGPMKLADIRKALPDFENGSVNTAASELREKGVLQSASRGVYQLAPETD